MAPPIQLPFPSPLIIPPLSPPHQQTFILLHGRGSSAAKFGPTLLSSTFTHNNSTAALRSTFPHAKFIFPTAPPQP
ncbi:hypothetical protein B0T25DRAFT_97573 [Lasiosphaeria hispida]|uniref:Phospholipase/carboxylesterase/thioesterase domain-containing protein n=1 Tax=Lasiosphaeria hispida TaxID=260671 RepID=A0AAJ0HQJ8_9PEZI|nr:hypothetical protein B0T25DRAFT_97573 [Lasiosphaeria hispida]